MVINTWPYLCLIKDISGLYFFLNSLDITNNIIDNMNINILFNTNVRPFHIEKDYVKLSLTEIFNRKFHQLNHILFNTVKFQSNISKTCVKILLHFSLIS